MVRIVKEKRVRRGPVAHVHRRSIGEPGRPPAKRANRHDRVAALRENSKIDKSAACRHEGNITTSGDDVTATPVQVITGDYEHNAVLCGG